MLLQQQPNNWSCLPTAFAIATNTSLEKFLIEVGHDGSEIWWPDSPEPYCRRAFHIQEMILACHNLGYIVTPFESYPVAGNYDKPLDLHPLDHNVQVQKIIENSIGVLIGVTRYGSPHAVAWDGKHCVEDNFLNLKGFKINQYWRLIKSLST